MEDDRDELVLEKIREAWRASMAQSTKPFASGSDCYSFPVMRTAEAFDGGMHEGEVSEGMSRSPLLYPGFSRNETVRLAGKNGAGSNDGHSNEVRRAASDRPSMQLRLQLTEDVVAMLDKQPSRRRGIMFVAVVFGQLGTDHAPSEYFVAEESLMRIRMLLQCALQRAGSDLRVAVVRKVIKDLDHLCRAKRMVSTKLYLPKEYADAMMFLSPKNRGRIIRLAFRASSLSISLKQLLRLQNLLGDRRERLSSKLHSSPEHYPEEEVAEIIGVISELFEPTRKGFAK